MDRNSGGDDSGEIYSTEDASYEDDESFESKTTPYREGSLRRKKGGPRRALAGLVVVAVLAIAGYIVISHFAKGNNAAQTQGQVAMSADELRSVVLADHIVVYWAGPVAGSKYALINRSGSYFVRYLPNGQGLNDTTSSYRVIATYPLKSAFLITKSAGAVAGNVGFTNVDGNAVFYVKTRPTNVYMGLKDRDIQIEIFDPGVDQALGLALLHNQIQQIS